MLNNIKNFLTDLVTDRGDGINSKIVCGIIGFIVLVIGLFVGVDERLYYIFAMCDVFYFGGSVVDNWTAPKTESIKTETISTKTNKESKTEIDVASMVNNAVNKLKGKGKK